MSDSASSAGLAAPIERPTVGPSASSTKAVGDRVQDGGGGLVAAARGAGHPDRELVAAEPAGDALGGEPARDLGQHEVAGGVAVAVVDGLEVVDVADQDAAGLVLGHGAAHGRHPVAAVEQAGQVVDPRLALELGDAGGHRRAGLAAADGLEREVVEVLVAQRRASPSAGPSSV